MQAPRERTLFPNHPDNPYFVATRVRFSLRSKSVARTTLGTRSFARGNWRRIFAAHGGGKRIPKIVRCIGDQPDVAAASNCGDGRAVCGTYRTVQPAAAAYWCSERRGCDGILRLGNHLRVGNRALACPRLPGYVAVFLLAFR